MKAPLPLPAANQNQLDARKNGLVRMEDMRYLDKIRDQFAMAALTGILSNSTTGSCSSPYLAERSYDIANSMMEARKK